MVGSAWGKNKTKARTRLMGFQEICRDAPARVSHEAVESKTGSEKLGTQEKASGWHAHKGTTLAAQPTDDNGLTKTKRTKRDSVGSTRTSTDGNLGVHGKRDSGGGGKKTLNNNCAPVIVSVHQRGRCRGWGLSEPLGT